MRIPDAENTIAEIMNTAGIYTAYVGKWHLSGKPAGNRWIPPGDRGSFTDFIGWESHHVDHWGGKIWADDPDDVIEMQGHESDALTDIACDKLEELSLMDKRFCLFVAFQSPHSPCKPPTEYLAMYEGKNLSFSPSVPTPAPEYNRPEWGCSYDFRTFIDRYYGEVTHLDACVGRLLRRLDELGLAEDTAVVFTSDHGDMTGSHGLYSKGIMMEEAVRIPLIFKLPGQPSRETDRLISTIDLMPTLLELMGLPPSERAEGVSHSKYLFGQDIKAVDSIILQHKDLCLIKGDYKLISDLDAIKPTALYNLVNDPHEMINLIDDENHIEMIEKGLIKLKSWLDDVRMRIGDVEDAKTFVHWYR